MDDAPDLLPLRAINEYVFCQRLFFIEYVERQFVESHDTIDGERVHRRVDEPKGRLVEEDASRQVPDVTSVDLSSRRLGIVGKIDLVRAEGERVVPIDFKRGRLPPASIGVYDPERVQVILQALLLREHGFTCEEARVYFNASKKHVSVQVDAEAEKFALDAVAGAQRVSTQTYLPPPLKDSPKCARCSLNVVCLPDETNLINGSGEDDIRSFGAPRDDRRPVYVLAPGTRVGLSGEVLEIRESNGESSVTARLMEVASLSLFGNVQVSSQACRALLRRDIPIFYLSYGGWLTGHARSIDDHSLDLREAQMRLLPEMRLRIARRLVEGKVRNQRTMVRRLLGSSARRTLQALAICIHRVIAAPSVEELLGLEGRAAQLYFAAFALMLVRKGEFEMRNRNRRPPVDPVNAMLSFGYAMLTKEALAAVIAIGFEPGVGVYHARRPGRPALALDLMEEFRPLIVDSTVLSLINTGEIKETHFVQRGIGVGLTDDGRRTFIRAFERRLQATVLHPVFGYEASYRRALWMQGRLMARAIQGDISEYPAFVTR